MKIVNSIFAILFLVFAFVQFNDPDPILWVIIYNNMAVISVLAVFGLRYRIWIGASIAFYSVYAIMLAGGAWEWLHSPDRSLLFDDIAKMQYPYIEETREFLGLAICIAVALFQFFSKPRRG